MMTKVQHTPGPWKIEKRKRNADAVEISACDGSWLTFARVFVKVDGEIDPEGEANARLIVAAPEMLAALKGIKAEFQRLKDAVMERTDMPFIAKARDAVYLDGVLAVIDSKAGEVIAKIEGSV